MVIRHTNIAKDREKLKRVFDVFVKEIDKCINHMTKDDKMKGWDRVVDDDDMHTKLLNLRRRLKDLAYRSVTEKEKGLEAELAFTVCLIKYFDDLNFRKGIESSF